MQHRTMTITVRGHSNDDIIVEAHQRNHEKNERVWVEEFSGYDSDKPKARYLGLSDGTLLSVCYTEEGVWRIAPVSLGQAKYQKVQEGVADGEYSDIVTVTWEGRAFGWVLFGAKDSPNLKTFPVSY